MICDACQHANRPDARFCLACGAELSQSCGACGRALPAAARFCDGCGARVGAAPARTSPDEPPPMPASAAAGYVDPRSYTPRHLAERILTSKTALEGERKHVTVLFADLADSTPLTQRLDPEEMHALMDRAFQLILEQVHRYEGTVNQFTGDGVMALFGAPIALEDAPRRAALAALAIQQALAPLGVDVAERHDASFRMRIGIHAGLVVVGKIGDDLRMDYTAVGDTTNLADRLQQLAPPGGVVVSDAMQRLVSGFFELERQPPVEVKGFAAPIAAHRVVRALESGGRLEAAGEAGLTPYVGRRRELDTLSAAFENAREGRGQVVFLVGEAGIGKSRMRHEFKRRLADEQHTWLEGRCASYAINKAFHPLADAVRRAIGVEERDDDPAVLAKLERYAALGGERLTWTLPYLHHLLSLPVGDSDVVEMDAATRRSETYRALQAHIQRATESGPLVFVIEDLHWIDAASEEFIAYLADAIPASHCLILLSFRPDYAQPFGDRSYHVRVALQALSERETTDMAHSLLEATGLPAEVRKLIARKAEGNPFFIEEVTKSLLEEGVLRREEGRVVLGRTIDEISVPDTIQDVLMARIDRLDEAPKRAIQIASVIGREFALRLLDRIAETGGRLSTVVDELRALELIYEKAAHPELAFMFKHALTHEVAYASMLVQRRRALHAIAGRAIEELYSDRLSDHYDALAHHFTQAEEWASALRYHELAAERAADAYANQAAAEHARRALEIADRLGEEVPAEQRRQLAGKLASYTWQISEFRASGDAFLRAAQHSSRPVDRSLALARASYSLHWAHDYAGAREAVAEALACAREHGLAEAEAHALVVDRFSAATNDGNVDEFERAAEQLRDVAEDPALRAFALSHLGEAAEWRGDYPRAVELTEQALTLARSERLPDVMIYSAWFLGKANTCLGRYGLAVGQLGEALEIAERIGSRGWKTRLLNTLGWAYAEFGCHDRAARLNRESTDLGREMVELELVPGAPEIYGNAAINLAGNRLAAGDPDGAMEIIDPVRVSLETSDDPWMLWRYALHFRNALARVALARGDAELTLQLADEELTEARSIGVQKVVARALELRGRALATMDRRDEAGATLREALGVAEGIGYPPVVWRARGLLAELGRREGRTADAKEHATRARELVGSLAGGLPDDDLRSSLLALGERLATEPLAAGL